jgi:WD40 repeat protein
LCSGTASGSVTLFDLKKRSEIRSFSGHTPTSAITSVTWRHDTHVVSSSTSGNILIHSVSGAAPPVHLRTSDTGVSSSSGGAASLAAVRDIHLSPHGRHQLSSCGDDAIVRLWDLDIGRQITKYQSYHQLPINCVRFSPIAPNLLASAGIDRLLCFYDITGKVAAQRIETEFPITTMDMHHAGCYVALGTMQVG